jgi:hypothetical protein
MKQSRFRISRSQLALTIVLAISFVLTSGACGTNSPNLYGKWIPSTGGAAPHGFPDRMELFSDGLHITDGNGGIYSMVGGKLKLSAGGHTIMFDYELRGARLTLKADGGQTIEYTKQK